jgi:lethal(2) giant larvae protein
VKEKEPEKKEVAAASEEKKEEEKKKEATGGEEAAAAAPVATPATEAKKETSPVTTPTAEHQKPVERQVEARGVEDSMSSIVKSLYFADTFILDGKLILFAILNG